MTHAGLLAALGPGHLATDIGHSLREGFSMFWETLWALVLGFGVSGAVQAFVSREAMQRHLGDHRPASVARASLYGMASSSCSYAATAMARALFARGADFLASMVFLFASTNLVVELGIVLAVLIGWQFLAAQFAGGIIMIVLLATLGGPWLAGAALAGARRRVSDHTASHGPDHGPDTDAGHGPDHGPDTDAGHEARPEGAPLRRRLRSAAGWADAAGYTLSDLRMLRREMVVGFGVAGFLATLVPSRVWNDLFLPGHGFWTSLENAAVGPLVAIASFVCSVGNVPLAAALWKGGIAFGGVVSFVFADLVTLPLLLIYAKQYGGRMTLRMLGLFWVVMSAAGLATQYLFEAAGWVPSSRPRVVADHALRLDATTVADIAALALFTLLAWLSRHRDRLGRGARYATDPVCGMQVEKAHAPALRHHEGTTVYFCSEHCRDHFDRHPERYLSTSASGAVSR